MGALHIVIVIYLMVMYLLFTFSAMHFTYEITFNKIYAFGFEHEAACIFHGGLGAVFYCMRGFYINYCVHKKKNIEDWAQWYLFRPIVGTIIGLYTYLIVKFIIDFFQIGFIQKYTFFGLFALALYAGYKGNKFLGGGEGKD